MVGSGPSCKLVWREPVKARVWPLGIVVDAVGNALNSTRPTGNLLSQLSGVGMP